jgi:hypothetical protein
MAVSWRTEGAALEHLAYAELNLADLLAQARSLRGQFARRRAGDYEVLLRSLGQHLDAEQFQMSGIVERDDEFIVSGSASGRYVDQSYPKQALRALNIERRVLRTETPVEADLASAAGPKTRRPRWLFRSKR